jgi:hypothetical protein
MRSPGVSLWVDVTWDRGGVRVGESFRGQVVEKSFGFFWVFLDVMSTTQIYGDRGVRSPQLQFCRRGRHSPSSISLAVMLSRAHWVGTRLDRLSSTER